MILKKFYLIMLSMFLAHLALSQLGNEDINKNKIEQDSTKKAYSKKGFLDIFEGEPGRAALYSFLLPGAGQAYNKRYWKVPIAVALEGGFIWNIVSQKNNYNLLDLKWRYFLENGVPPASCENVSIEAIKRARDRSRKKMEYSWVWWGVTHIVVTLEAFINRHLMDFDISDDLSIQYKSQQNIHSVNSYTPGIGIVFTFD